MNSEIGCTRDLSWTSAIGDHGPALDDLHPMWVKRVQIEDAGAVSPPHRHAYCECEMLSKGVIVQHAEGEEEQRKAGSVFFTGPGIPHWSQVVESPVEYYVIYFKPWVLMGQGAGVDAGEIIKRFTSRQALSERLLRPPRPFQRKLQHDMQQILEEFEERRFGRELKLVAALQNILVDLLRWESRNSRDSTRFKPGVNWQELELALAFIHTNYTKKIYTRDIAAAVFMSESSLEALFREAMGMPWVRYVQRYRIQHAVTLLVERRCNVTETAQCVGFNSLSHFNATFRSIMGVSPSQFMKQTQESKLNP